MVERTAKPPVATFLSHEPFVAGGSITLSDEEMNHIRALRLSAGAAVALRDGAGNGAEGVLVRIAKNAAVVEISSARQFQQLPPVHLLAPIADRERMLSLGEKATELGVTTWRPVLWKRSRSVSPRGEGPTFQQKLKARMTSALLQSRGGWLPEIFPEATVDRAITSSPPGTRLFLDSDELEGASSVLQAAMRLTSLDVKSPVVIALGPEGGVEPAERDQFLAAGFVRTSLGPYVLRFETAGIAALAMVRSMLGREDK
jgi:16S rRNA (uracil1498-N3)-methyltransferase